MHFVVELKRSASRDCKNKLIQLPDDYGDTAVDIEDDLQGRAEGGENGGRPTDVADTRWQVDDASHDIPVSILEGIWKSISGRLNGQIPSLNEQVSNRSG